MVLGACQGEDGDDDGSPGSTGDGGGGATSEGGDGDSGDDDGGGDSGSSGGSGDGSTDGDDGTNGSSGSDGSSAGDSGGDLPSGTFLMDDDGYVVFDIESIAGENPPDPWIFRSDAPCSGRPECDVLGSGFYQFIEGEQCGQVGEGHGLMEFQFEAKQAGLHRFAWRNMRDHTGGCGGDRNNDSYLAFPSANADDHFKQPFKAYGGGNNDFDWWATYDIEELGKNEICLDFDAGVHTVQIMGRSNQHAIDRVALIRVDSGEADCLSPSMLQGLDDRPVTGQAP